MLIGIGLVLMLISRSISKSIFVVIALVLSYLTSLGISELISAKMLHIDSFNWNVPFFSFIMIMALGVDYSIFLIMKYNELDGDWKSAFIQASSHIGSFVVSAAIILGGTFAALLIPSGVATLIQVSCIVIIALILLSLITLPVLLPSLIGISDKISNLSKK